MEFGYDAFGDHEILEMFLYAANPRGDTNESAHNLMEHFGSFDAVMEADPDELTAVPGIGPQAAFQLSLAREMMRRFARSRMTEKRAYKSARQIAEYMWSYFFGLDHERLYMLLFDNRMTLISHICLSVGTVNSTALPKREMLEAVIKKHASCVVLAHNHPHGTVTPSNEDILATTEAAEILRTIGVPLCEHLVITDTSFKSIMKDHYHLPYMMSPDFVGNRFVGDMDWNAFYDVDEDTFRFSMLDEFAGA